MNFILYILFFAEAALCAKILTINTIPAYSHETVYAEVWKELSIRGHKIVSITSHPVNNNSLTNLKEIDVSFLINLWINLRKMKTENNLRKEYEILIKLTEELFCLKEIQNLKNENFDLIIAEWVLPAIFGYSAYFKTPLIGIMSTQIFNNQYYDFGNPVHPFVYPEFFLPFTTANNYWEKFTSFKTSIWLKYIFYSYVYPTSNDMIKKYIGDDLPSAEEISRNVSLILVNYNSVLNKPRQTLPNVVEFSGLLAKKTSKYLLPQNIKSFLDNATQGAIYFSLGSYIKSNMLSDKLISIFLNSFSELPYKVLWKFDNASVLTSKNVMISTWLPQQEVLAHKNIKVFITQCGLQSIEEAIQNRVPMIGVPFLMDQASNAKALSSKGISIYIDKTSVTKDQFKNAIEEIAENPMYKQRIEEIARIFEDQPIDSKENIIWWIEYVIRHKGAAHLRSPFLDIPWYQLMCLDILAFLVLVSVTTIYIITNIVRIIIKRVYS